MMPDVWRVPTILGVMACSALALFAAAVIGSMVIRRRNALATTVAVIASVGVLATVPAIGMRMTAARIAESVGIDVMYIDPGVAGYFAPPLFAAFAFLVGDRVLDRRWTDRRALLFCVWVVTFTTLNVINYCSPGWCETIGFPFPWRAWSDSILTFGEPDLVHVAIERAVPATAALVDLFAFVAVPVVLARRLRPADDRSSSARVTPPLE